MPVVTDFHILCWGVSLLHDPLTWLVNWLKQLDKEGSICPGSWLFPLLTMNISAHLVWGQKPLQPKTCFLRTYYTVPVIHRGFLISGVLQPRLRATVRLWKCPKNQPETPSLLFSFSWLLKVGFTPRSFTLCFVCFLDFVYSALWTCRVSLDPPAQVLPIPLSPQSSGCSHLYVNLRGSSRTWWATPLESKGDQLHML